MSYRVVPGPAALRKLGGIPDAAMTALTQTLAEIAEDPYNAMASQPIAVNPKERWTVFGDGVGFLEIAIDDDVGVITLVDLAWAG